eukprot:CAMPEP_0173248680 /NCGR_PEP_ID=MMETSP1142-20121109/18603_1 /TAXON_ID=483371 /ORGANISM="non described non described, Strain CCMP2298" /LENGTH=89 /DNA_ID=CAMNT_0014181233 /DNA_START=495 /DNA_END=764 /DNA_ORIENTATION=-
MTEAPWVVQMAVRYFRGPSHLEVTVHVGSSAIADNIVGVCRSYSTAFICNLGIVLQGEQEDELPEVALACGALRFVDCTVHCPLNHCDF